MGIGNTGIPTGGVQTAQHSLPLMGIGNDYKQYIDLADELDTSLPLMGIGNLLVAATVSGVPEGVLITPHGDWERSFPRRRPRR